MPSGAVISGAFVMTSRTSVVAISNGETKRMSRLVMMPTSVPSPSTTGQAGDAELAAEGVDLGHGRVGRRRDGVRDHARLAALDLVDVRGLVVDREVAVDDADAALAGHGDGHARLGDGVHRGREQRARRRGCAW